MATLLSQFQTIKNSCTHLIVAVEDVSDLWPLVKNGFEERLPFKKACLNNKAKKAVFVEDLSAEFILTTDARLRSRYPQEQFLFWFREPYATVVLVSCEDVDEFKTILKPRLKLIIQNDEREWFIVFVSKAHPSNEQAVKMSKKVYAKLEVDFSSKRRERCCKLDIYGPEANFWDDLEFKMTESIRNMLDRRVQFYEDEIRRLNEQRSMPNWSFCNFFILKEILAFMFAMTHLHEDSLREYDELELCYSETVNIPEKRKDFGGLEQGDDDAALLNPGKKPLTQFAQDDSFREFEFRQYIFSCQANLLFKLGRPFEVASRGYLFIISFSKALALHEPILPFCLREVWIITACINLINVTSGKYDSGSGNLVAEKEFYHIQGDLYSLCRIKLMRLAYLMGYGTEIERSPVNSASLSMLPWPKPEIWPSVPADASSDVLLKEKIILQFSPKVKYFGIQRKLLPLGPSVLLREANRRRASLSAGNMQEIFDSHNFTDRSGLDVSAKMISTLPKAHTMSMLRNNSSLGVETSIDRPMRISEIHVAAENALRQTISDSGLRKVLSSVEEFEQKFLELTKGAAESYHRSLRKRHAVVFDGEIGTFFYKHGNFDLAAKSYEKVCALYAGEGWQELLADVLPSLAECQNILNDKAGYLSTCVRLLSLEKGLFSTRERRTFQLELARLAHSEMKDPVHLDVSSLITFSGNPGPPLELCDGDPGLLSVILWSGFPDDITLDSLNFSLVATDADDGLKPLWKSGAVTLIPGRNSVIVDLPPQKPGSYVLGVLTGRIRYLIFRSHGFSKGVPTDSDDFMSYEKPPRPILRVLEPRPLVDISAAVSSALLMNECQWVGVVIRPLGYSLKGAIFHINTGPGLVINDSFGIEVESHENMTCTDEQGNTTQESQDNGSEDIVTECRQPNLQKSFVNLPDWVSNVTSVIWLPVRAVSDGIARGVSSATSQRQSIVDGMRTVALKLEFGASHHQTFERTLAVHFTDPFHVTMRVADKGNNGTLLLQVIIHSQVKAMLTVCDAWLDLQDGFVHMDHHCSKRLTSSFFPLLVSPSSTAGMLFPICLGNANSRVDGGVPRLDSILNLRYNICGSRSMGAHFPVSSDSKELMFRCALLLQRPVLDPCVAIGFMPLSSLLRVGELITMKWRLERLKDDKDDSLIFEVDANSEKWMIAGRKKGHAFLPMKQGSRVVISVMCLPLVAGHLHPPRIGLPGVDASGISLSPAGPHLICVLPPALSSSFFVPA